jgi:hypothetical protein
LELEEKQALTVTLIDTQHRLEAQLATEKHESERYQLEAQALQKKLETMEERGRRKLLSEDHSDDTPHASSSAGGGGGENGGGGVDGAVVGDEGDISGDNKTAEAGSGSGSGTSSYAEIMKDSSGGGKHHKKRHHHHHHITERSPSIDPISRMVAQLPERERTAHLASELVAATDRVKESQAKITKLEEEAKKREREFANLKAAKAETERRLIALENKTPGGGGGLGGLGGKKSRGPSQSPKLDQQMRTSGGGRESVTSPTDSLKSFGFGSHDIMAEDEEHHHGEDNDDGDEDDEEGGGEHISAAELTRLRTALTVAEEEAERLKDELAEALEDAALLKQLNDMDQLTIGSLTSGNHPHHVEANKQQLLQKKESMIEQESLNKKNMDLKQEVIRLKKEIEECNEKLEVETRA